MFCPSKQDRLQLFLGLQTAQKDQYTNSKKISPVCKQQKNKTGLQAKKKKEIDVTKQMYCKYNLQGIVCILISNLTSFHMCV